MSSMMPIFFAGAPDLLTDPPDAQSADPGQESVGRGKKPTRKKRVITAARKEQNRVAQKAFRQRQKERRGEHGQKEARQRPSLLPHPDRTARTVKNNRGKDFSNSESARRENLEKLYSAGSVATRGRVSPVNGGCVHETSPEASALDVRGDVRGYRIPATESAKSLGDQLYQGLSSTSETPISHRPDNPSDLLSDPHANALQFLPTTIFSAVLHNALALGFEPTELETCQSGCLSPFYRPSAPQDDPAALLAATMSNLPSTTPRNLRPTLTQILIPHHPSLDLIPLPQLRDRAIMLSAAMPGIFNMWELKLDIYQRGGLVALRWRDGSNGGIECQPWEKTSWVASPWFLKKWSMIVAEERCNLCRGYGHGGDLGFEEDRFRLRGLFIV